MSTAEQKERMFPAYAPYGTFKNFVASFREHGPPARIDRSTMTGLSGGTQSHLTSTLKFLDLIGASGEPKSALESLVEGLRADEWAPSLAQVVSRAYAPVIGDLDIERASSGQVVDAFKKTGMDGATLDKALRFYVQALKDAQIKHSPQVAKLKPRNQIRKPPKPKGAVGAAPAAGDPPPPPSGGQVQGDPPGMIYFPILIKGKPGGRILVPETITADECKMVDIAADAVKAYAGQIA